MTPFTRLNLTASALVAMSLIVLPGLFMFAGNTKHVLMAPVDLVALASFLIISGMVLCIVLFAVLAAGGEQNSMTLLNVVFFLVIAAAVQYYFLSDNISHIDGRPPRSITFWQLVWEQMFYAVLVCLVYRYRQQILMNIRLLLGAVCLFHLLNLGTAITQLETVVREPARMDSATDMAVFSSNENVVHIVLDGFQSDLFRQSIDNDPGLAEAFDGFLYYPDALGNTEVTELSFGAFLTGIDYKNDETIQDYLVNSGLVGTDDPERFNPATNILKNAESGGFHVAVASPHNMFFKRKVGEAQHFYLIPRPYRPGISPMEVADYKVAFIADLVLFRSVPTFARDWVYDGGRWRLSRFFAPDFELTAGHHVSLRYLSDVIERFRLSGEETKVYRLFHLMTPHGPFVTNEDCTVTDRDLYWGHKNIYNQAHCGLLKVAELLDRLRQAGIYDSVTILIHGDHGINLPPDGAPGGDIAHSIVGDSNPLLLLKPPRRRGRLESIDAEVALSDIPNTLANLLALEGDFGGIDFLNEQPSGRTRWFSISHPGWYSEKTDRFTEWNRYEVTGPLRDPSSWRLSIP